uniref:Uncharacterized protein n=1 Tax=Lotharella globosa TaxID=91324 RepID=A0A7S4DWB4_9EUKA
MATAEFYSEQLVDLLDYRNKSVVGARFLGPLDVCLVRRRTGGSYIPFLSAPRETAYLHWFLGVDTSSVAAICAYYQRLRALDSGDYASGNGNGRGEIVGVTIGVYNAFSGMDLRVTIDMEAKPIVSVCAVDGNLMQHDRVTENMLDGAYVSSCLRSIAMPPSIVPSLHCEGEGVSASKEELFLKAAERLLDKGALVRGAENSGLVSRHGAMTILQTLVTQHFIQRSKLSQGARFFRPLITFRPLVAASAAKLLKMRGERRAAASLLVEALKAAPRSVPLLLAQAEILLELKMPELALPLATDAAKYGPLELRTWVVAARVHIALGDPVMAIVCLNSLPDEPEPTDLAETDIHDLVALPHDAPSENSVSMRPAGSKPRHEWAYHDLDREVEEVLMPDIMGLREVDEQQPVLSNRLHGDFLKAYEVLVQLLVDLDFEKLDSLVRDLFYPGEARHAASARLAASEDSTKAAGLAAAAGGQLLEAEERKLKKLERRAARVDRKLKKYERNTPGGEQVQQRIRSNPTNSSAQVDDNVGSKSVADVKGDNNDVARDTLIPNGNDNQSPASNNRNRRDGKEGKSSVRRVRGGVLHGKDVMGAAKAQLAIPMMTVSRVFAQPTMKEAQNVAAVTAGALAAKSAISKKVDIEDDEVEVEERNTGRAARKMKLMRRHQREQKQIMTSPAPARRTRWRTRSGAAVPRQMCRAQLSGMLSLLKDDIRAMQELRVELQKCLDQHGEDWQYHLGSTRTQHRWLQFGKVARRMHMYQEAEVFLDLCLSYGYSRGAHAELSRLFVDVGMLAPALGSLCDLAKADEEAEDVVISGRSSLPVAVEEIMRSVVDSFGLDAVIKALDEMEDVGPYVEKAREKVMKCYENEDVKESGSTAEQITVSESPTAENKLKI